MGLPEDRTRPSQTTRRLASSKSDREELLAQKLRDDRQADNRGAVEQDRKQIQQGRATSREDRQKFHADRTKYRQDMQRLRADRHRLRGEGGKGRAK